MADEDLCEERNTLAEFLHEQGTPREKAGEIVAAVEDALARAHRGFLSRRDLATEAKRLMSDIKEFRSSLEILKNLTAALNPTSELWFFLRLSETLSSGVDLTSAEGAEKALVEGKGFDRIMQGREDFKQAVAAFRDTLDRIDADRMLNDLEVAAGRVTDPSARVLTRSGNPKDETRLMLGLELAGLYEFATGKAPTFSAEATPDSPGTKFGYFVALAARLSPDRKELEKGFSRLVRTAVERSRKPGKNKNGAVTESAQKK
jgi:hypothetical protein